MPPRRKTTTEAGSKPAPRRSTRAKTIKKGTTAVARRAGHRNVRGLRGGLANMPNMPLDVLLEIFGFLHPRDLLSLARTSRDFRAFLMSRTRSLALWKAARQQIEGLPDVPPPLSEPAYANLLFFNYCHGCLKATGNSPAIWSLLIHCCNACKDDMESDVGLTQPTSCAMIRLRKSIPTTSIRLLDLTHSAVRRGQLGNCDISYHRVDFYAFLRTWKGMKDATVEEKKQFIKEREVLVAERKKVAERLYHWEKDVKAQQDAVKEAIKEDRFAAVLDKLREEGWGEELEKMGRWGQHRLYNMPVICRPNKLTDRGWGNMRDEVIECIENIRAKRLRTEYRTMINKRMGYLKRALQTYTQAELLQSKDCIVYVTLTDCALIPEIRAVLEDTSQDFSAEQMTAQLVDVLPALVARWTEERKSELATIMVKVLGDSDAAHVADPLDLAIAHFKCKGCYGYGSETYSLRFPAVLGHSCFRTRLDFADSYHDAVLSDLSTCNTRTVLNTVSSSLIAAEDMKKSMKIVREVIEACRCDPDSVTFAEMEARDTRLRCLLCAQVSQQTLFTWQAAIEHTTSRDDSHNYLRGRKEGRVPVRSFWECVPEEHAATARALEAVPERLSVKDDYLHDAMCMWCCRRNLVGEIKRHLQGFEHAIQEPQLDVDFFLRKEPREPITMYSNLYSKIPSKIALVKSGKAFFAESF
ncbi:hypothetical protein C8Q80DRAFT_1185423 [Daedaleopsis nitida]|nr:hypothetical protein C8Q80DRAFT_1185423 [Daedaleopsis nitida]